jgi:hypothetical protein
MKINARKVGNALAANIGIGSWLKGSGFRRQDADKQLVVQVLEVEIGSFNVKHRGFSGKKGLGREGHELRDGF